jgi:hypothetical protein
VNVKRPLVFASALVATLSMFTSPAAAKPPSPPAGSTGTGQVFFPNPVASTGNQALTDQKDADYPALASAYQVVTLTNLDGSGYLRGDWANVVSSTGPLAYSPTNTFIYRRNDDRFEQVMAYYWVTEAQKYIQSLGFGSRLPAINRESQDVRINQYGADNAFYWDKKDLMRFGKGGVDDAEDGDVILHEYGHAIQDAQSPGFGSSPEAGAIGEGFSDYWAATVTQTIAPSSDPACIGDWDATSYTATIPHCLRRIDTDLRYPDDLNGSVHHDGQIWSAALWDIRNEVGSRTADTLILDAQFDFAPDTSMPAAASATVDAALELYGAAVARDVRIVFEEHGLL